MDTEKCQGDSDIMSVTPQQQESGMEKLVVSNLETAEDPKKQEMSPAPVEEPDQVAVNGHDAGSPMIHNQTSDSPDEGNESMMQFEETSEAKTEVKETSEQEAPRGVSEKVEESVEAEIMSDAVHPQLNPDGSPEEFSDPPAAIITTNTEPENIQLEQQPAAENTPESVPLQEPLAENDPEPEPDKLVELVPEAEPAEQTLPEPEQLLQSVEKASHTEQMTAVKEVGREIEMGPPPEDSTKEGVAIQKWIATEPSKEEGVEKPADEPMAAPAKSELVKEACAEVPSLTEAAEVVNTMPVVEADVVEGPGSTAVGDMDQEEEETVPAPGSLSFALLEHEQTKVALRASRTLIVLRGLPGSGKSFLAQAIADSYQNLCSIVSSDDHGVKPEHSGGSADDYKGLDEAVVICCGATTAASVVVVDDTNHTQDRLARLGEIAEQNRLVALYLEPRTEWSRDLSQLASRTRRGLEEAQIEAMKGPLEEVSLPLFFGWFLAPTIQIKVRCTTMDFLKTLDTLEAFKKHLADFPVETEKEVDLEQYFPSKGPLHCTTKFCDYGKAEGAKEYSEKPSVHEMYGSVFELSLSALFVTPRTVGARVSLSGEQLELWPADADKEAEAAVPGSGALPLGSRAHITLGCAEGVEPVQTGLDLLEILVLQQAGQQGELVEEMELGSLVYFDKGRWLLNLREPIPAQAFFSSYFGPKKADATKKEPEKKKKKCTIL